MLLNLEGNQAGVTLHSVVLDITWIVGNQSSLSLWNDRWFDGQMLSSVVQIPEALEFTNDYTLGHLIQNGWWILPVQFHENLQGVCQRILEVEILEQPEDQLVWLGSTNGEVSIKEAYHCYRERATEYGGTKTFGRPISLQSSVCVL